jgi:inhibitor of KinA sporulation pathway (predicted exonuclease)
MIRISLDLECEQPNTNHQTPDSALSESRIIQVGYVIFDDHNFEKEPTILKTYCRTVNIGVKLSSFIKDLTKITDEDILLGSTLKEIIDELHQDQILYNTSRKLLTWGAGDQEAIRRELGPDYPWGFGRSAFNVKHLYQLSREAQGLNPSGGLKKSMNRLSLKFDGVAHNAAVDALNTLKVFCYLSSKFKPVSTI